MKGLFWIFVSIALVKGKLKPQRKEAYHVNCIFAGEEESNCDVFWKSSQRNVEIVVPLQLLKPMDSLFQITTVPFYSKYKSLSFAATSDTSFALSSFEPCQAEKSYGMTLKDHVEEWLHLNPQNGQLQITESGLQMAQKGKKDMQF